jgi:hypothetical protein
MPSERDCAPGLIVRAKDWPYGLRCGECSRLLKDGDCYAERWTGMMHDRPAVMIVCSRCAEAAHDHP